MRYVPDLLQWLFCSEGDREVSGDRLSLWHRMPAGVHGARGEVTVWHLLVFIGNEAILWHMAVHLSENRNSDDVPKDCQVQKVLFSAACSYVALSSAIAVSLAVLCSMFCMHGCISLSWLCNCIKCMRRLANRGDSRGRHSVMFWFWVYVPGEGMWFSGQAETGGL